MGMMKKILQYCFGFIFFFITFVATTALIFGGAGMSLESAIKGKTVLAIVACISGYCFYRLMKKTTFYFLTINYFKKLIKW